jgi:hypothetical protein
MNKAKPNVTFSKKVESYDDWRLLDEDQKSILANTVTQLLLKRMQQRDIAEQTGVSRHIIVKLAEVNGLARKGKYKGLDTSKMINVLVTDIDVVPDPNILYYDYSDTTGNVEDLIEDEVTESKEEGEPVTRSNLSDIKREVLPLLKQLILQHVGSTLREVKFVTDHGDITYKVD